MVLDIESKKMFAHKIKSLEEIRKEIGPFPRDKKVIMCHGTFDIVHPGHIRHLLYAKTKGDFLIASLTADKHIYKGNMRPYVPQELRAINLAALEMVDYVLIDFEDKPLNNLAILRPDYYAKGYEYSSDGVHPKTQEELAVLDSYGGEIIFTPGDIVYSSSSIVERDPPPIAIEKLITLFNAEDVTFEQLRASLDSMTGIKVHVIGDTIVDSLSHCTLIGGMTKTPTMSVRYDSRSDYVGGAGIVAKHLKAAGANVTFSTVLGKDSFGEFVLENLSAAGINCQPIFESSRPTTQKNAIVAGDYRLLKIDTVDNRSISDYTLRKLREQINKNDADLVIFSDFRHGIFNKGTIPNLIDVIPRRAIRVADSQVATRWGNILEFKGFDLITPNEREARFALGDQDSVVRPLGYKLYEQAGCRILILKCGSRGTITFRHLSKDDVRAFFTLDSFTNQVKDAVGAGDALLAYASLSLASGGKDLVASALGSIAAALECEVDGNVPVTQEDLLNRIATIERLAAFS